MDELDAQDAQNLRDQLKRVDHLLHHRFWKSLNLQERPAGLMIMSRLRKAASREEDGLRVSELALASGITASGITQIVTGLEERGMIGRKMDPEDRRAVRVYLTEKGRRNTDEMVATLDAVFGDIVEHLGHEKVRVFLDILNDLIAYLDKPEAEPGSAAETRSAEQ